MAGEPSRFRNLQLEREDSFGVENASPFSSSLYLPIRSEFDDAALVSQWITDQTATDDDGAHPEIEGSKAGQVLPIPCYGQGLGVVTSGQGAGDGQTPTIDALDLVLASLYGATEILTGDTVDSTPTPTANAFDLTTQSSLTTSGVVMLGVELSTGIEWVPGTVSSGTVTLLYNLSAAPSGGETVYGSINHQWTQTLTESFSYQGQSLTKLGTRQFVVYGLMTGALSVSAPLRDLWMLDAEAMVADWDDNSTGLHDDALTTVTPGQKAPHMGGIATIAPAGVATYSSSYSRCFRGPSSFDWTRNLSIRSCSTNANGIDFYNLTGAPSFSGTTIHDRSATWRDAKRAGTLYQMIVAASKTPGSACGFYEPRVGIQEGEPDRNVTDEVLTESVNWQRMTGQTSRHAVFFRG